jgi:hypothetical protein
MQMWLFHVRFLLSQVNMFRLDVQMNMFRLERHRVSRLTFQFPCIIFWFRRGGVLKVIR